jgi:ribosomal protein S18 acetylase RimI-like enzyme
VSFTLRPATDADAPFLYALHRAAMHDAIAATWGWDEAWQRAYFAEHFVPEGIALIVHAGEAVGMLELRDRADDRYVANLKLLPEAQGRGLGTAVMRRVLAEAAARGVPVRLQVLEANTGARKLYERLGFVATGTVPPHVLMEYSGTREPT